MKCLEKVNVFNMLALPDAFIVKKVAVAGRCWLTDLSYW